MTASLGGKSERGGSGFFFEFGQEKFGFRFIKVGVQTYLTFEFERYGEAVSYDINVRPCIKSGKGR